MKVLIADGLAKEGLAKLEAIKEIELLNHTGISREELMKVLPQAQILVVRSRTKVDAQLIEAGPNLKVILRAGIGLDNVDVSAATERAIVVMNAPSGNIVTTAEHALSLLMSVSRRISQADAALRKGKWEKKKYQGNELSGKTLGIIGLGNIGRVVAQKAQGLGLKVVAHDPFLSEEAAAKLNIKLLPMEGLLKTSDYVSIHVPLSDATHHLIGEKELSLMKPTAFLINCARGGIVDEKALEKALEKETIQGCALDVFEKEPPGDHPLFKFPNTVFTPHLGASTDEAQTLVSLEVADQLTQYVQDGALKNAINVPNISLEKLSIIRPHLQLCEKLGAFISQLAPQKIKKLKVHFEGYGDYDREIMTLSVLQGFLTPLMESGVNFVNAKKLLAERGIRVEESFEVTCADYSSVIRVWAEGDQTVSCAGTLFGKQSARIVQVDQYKIDAEPQGCLLFTRNTDQPGVIGRVGAILGNAGVNIARMHLGVDKDKGEAIALINIDSRVKPEVIKKLEKAEGMLSVKQIKL